jgi:polyene glycosyltransferase
VLDVSSNITLPLYHAVSAHYKDKHNRPDLVVIDGMTLHAYTLVDEFNIPYVIAFPSSSVMFNEDPLYVPYMLSGFPSKMRLWQRSLNVAVRLVMSAVAPYVFSPYEKQREELGVPLNETVADMLSTHLVLHETYFPFDAPRPLQINHKLVGPLLPKHFLALSDDIRQWLDDRETVVYVCFGTMAVLLKDEVNELIKGLQEVPRVSVLWSLHEEQHHLLPPSLPSSFRIASFVSQQAVLQHANVKAFVTHGGHNSVHESISAGKPMLVIPLQADQPSNAVKVEDHGAGLKIDKGKITSSRVKEKLQQIIEDDRFAANCKRLARIANLTGGASRAVDYIEQAMTMDMREYFEAANVKIPFYQRFLLDVLAVYTLLLAFVVLSLYKCLSLCFGRGAHRGEPVSGVGRGVGSRKAKRL